MKISTNDRASNSKILEKKMKIKSSEKDTTMMDCKSFAKELPDLVLTPGARPGLAAVAHLRACPPCAEEYVALQKTFGLLDSWRVLEPTAYFDQKMAVRLREEQAAPRMNWFERLETRLQLNTGRSFRPAMAGALALALILGGGSYAGISGVFQQSSATHASATVNDLEILDHNEQAFQVMDELQQDESNAPNQQDRQGDTTAQPAS